MVPQQMSLQGLLNVLFDMFGYFGMLAGGIYSNPLQKQNALCGFKDPARLEITWRFPQGCLKQRCLVCELPEIVELAEAGTLWL